MKLTSFWATWFLMCLAVGGIFAWYITVRNPRAAETDQLFNQVGKARHMFGGDNDVPLVLRSKVAMGTGYGSQHPARSNSTGLGRAGNRTREIVRDDRGQPGDGVG